MSGEYGVMYRVGPAFYTRRFEEGFELGPEMLVPEIYDYMLEEIGDDLTLAIVDSELQLLGTVELDAPQNLQWAFNEMEVDPELRVGMQDYLMQVFIALGLAQPVPFGSN